MATNLKPNNVNYLKTSSLVLGRILLILTILLMLSGSLIGVIYPTTLGLGIYYLILYLVIKTLNPVNKIQKYLFGVLFFIPIIWAIIDFEGLLGIIRI